MVKVFFERFKSAISDAERYLHRGRLLPTLDIHLRHNGFFRRTFLDSDTKINRARCQCPTVLDSMFPSLFDSIRLGRFRKTVPACDYCSTRKSNQPSTSARIIPIMVETDDTEKNTKTKALNQMNHIILDDDDVTEIIDCTADDSSIKPTNYTYKSHRQHTSADKNSIESPVILDEVDSVSHCHSDWPLLKSSKELHSDTGKVNFMRSASVESLESVFALPASDNLNSKEQITGDNWTHFTNSVTINKATECQEEIDCSNTVVSEDPSFNKKDSSAKDGCAVELKDSPPPDHPVYDLLAKKLTREHRKIHYIMGDGNCFFRALSKVLYGCETYHKAVRRLIIDIIATNKSHFAQFVDGEDVQDHVEKMSETHCWATTCEIYAAATVLQRDIYMLTPNYRNSTYSWLLFKPVFKINEGQTEFTKHSCCITLCNTNGNHYDLVVADHGKCNCFMPHPKLGGVNAHIDLT